ncbi:hypothetical protein M434DRAFT_231148 [Hypoxylon sp. CO27-5]|nr:hypothetical protein M434DRAFT_231148 [Hypoxylon sp. CO27-5]
MRRNREDIQGLLIALRSSFCRLARYAHVVRWTLTHTHTHTHGHVLSLSLSLSLASRLFLLFGRLGRLFSF